LPAYLTISLEGRVKGEKFGNGKKGKSRGGFPAQKRGLDHFEREEGGRALPGKEGEREKKF